MFKLPLLFGHLGSILFYPCHLLEIMWSIAHSHLNITRIEFRIKPMSPSIRFHHFLTCSQTYLQSDSRTFVAQMDPTNPLNSKFLVGHVGSRKFSRNGNGKFFECHIIHLIKLQTCYFHTLWGSQCLNISKFLRQR